MTELCLCRDGWPVLCVDTDWLRAVGGLTFLMLMLFLRIRQLME